VSAPTVSRQSRAGRTSRSMHTQRNAGRTQPADELQRSSTTLVCLPLQRHSASCVLSNTATRSAHAICGLVRTTSLQRASSRSQQYRNCKVF
jgi:hypothetical protein